MAPQALGLGVGLALGAAKGGAGGPPPSVPFQAVNADGWTVTHADPPAYSVAAPVSFAVERPGFDGTGAPVTRTDEVILTGRLRRPYPDHATLTPDRVALSAFIHQGDVVPGAVNNSTRPYPRPQAVWLQHDHLEVEDGILTLGLVVAHHYARNRAPVAAVRFTVSDGSASVSQTVAAMTWEGYAASGLGAPAYRAALDVSGLADGALAVDATIFPWVGPAFTLSADGLPAPGMHLCPLTAWKGVARTYAYVAPGGSDATGVASTTAATAEAAPFATMSAAGAAIQALAGNCSGGVIRFQPGTYTVASNGSRTTPTAPMIYEAADPAAVATTVIQDDSATKSSNNLPPRTVIRNLTLRKIGGSVTIFRPPSDEAAMCAFVGCRMDRNGTSQINYWIRQGGRLWFIDCHEVGGDILLGDYFSTNPKNSNFIGCDGLVGTSVINAVACVIRRNLNFGAPVNGRTRSSAGGIMGFCFQSGSGDANFVLTVDEDLSAGNDLGLGLVGNVVERAAGSTNGAIRIAADGSTKRCTNINLQMLTLPGAAEPGRINMFYNDTGSVPSEKWCSFRANVVPRFATKTDVFAADGALTGNWPVAMRVAHAHVAMTDGSTATNSTVGAGSWRREIVFPALQWGDGGSGALDPLWTDDRSFSGSGTGFGDYSPQPASPLLPVPAAAMPYNFDQRGRPVPDDGTAMPGALQKAG